MKGSQWVPLSWNILELCLFYVDASDTDLCDGTDHVNEFSIIINNDLTWLDKIEFWTQLNGLRYFSNKSAGYYCGPCGGYLGTMSVTPDLEKINYPTSSHLFLKRSLLCQRCVLNTGQISCS